MIMLLRNTFLVSDEAIRDAVEVIAAGKPWDHVTRNGQTIAANSARSIVRILVEGHDRGLWQDPHTITAPLHVSNRRWRQATAELAHDYPARISGWPSPRRERTSFNKEHQQPTGCPEGGEILCSSISPIQCAVVCAVVQQHVLSVLSVHLIRHPTSRLADSDISVSYQPKICSRDIVLTRIHGV
jgi:hypothetical protein